MANQVAFAKFTAPTIADGLVILPSVGLFQVFGISTLARGQERVKLPLDQLIRRGWINTGGAQGLLSQQHGDVQQDPGGGLRQDFQTVVSGGGFGAVSVAPSVQIAHGMCSASSQSLPKTTLMASLFASEKAGVHYVIGEIRDKFLQNGGTAEFGYPVTDEVPTPDGFGLMTRFERGTIYWYAGQNAQIGEPKAPRLRVAPMPGHQ
jgi:uncharacterized protein with LGFP repeats